MTEPSTPDTNDPRTFEQILERLEATVSAMEEGELGLDEALARYEEGVKLLRQSYEILERAERKIELLSGLDAEGNPITQPVIDEATLAPTAEKARRPRPRRE